MSSQELREFRDSLAGLSFLDLLAVLRGLEKMDDRGNTEFKAEMVRLVKRKLIRAI